MAQHPNFIGQNQLECLRSLNIATKTFHPMPKNIVEAVYGPEMINILQEMQDIFPMQNPQPNESLQYIMFKAGQRSVIEWLNQRLEN